MCWYVVLHEVEQYGAPTNHYHLYCATTKLFKMLISHTHDILNSLPFALFLSFRVVTQSTGSWLVWLLAWPLLAALACVFISYGFVIYPRFACLFAFSSQTFRHLQNTKMCSRLLLLVLIISYKFPSRWWWSITLHMMVWCQKTWLWTATALLLVCLSLSFAPSL